MVPLDKPLVLHTQRTTIFQWMHQNNHMEIPSVSLFLASSISHSFLALAFNMFHLLCLLSEINNSNLFNLFFHVSFLMLVIIIVALCWTFLTPAISFFDARSQELYIVIQIRANYYLSPCPLRILMFCLLSVKSIHCVKAIIKHKKMYIFRV